MSHLNLLWKSQAEYVTGYVTGYVTTAFPTWFRYMSSSHVELATDCAILHFGRSVH